VRPDSELPDGVYVLIRRRTVVTNQGYVPQPFTVADYRARVAALGVGGGAIMSGSFKADDQTYLCAACSRWG
jgi:predicted TIM-barrel fold metal-dependent hydrolase